MSRNLAATLAAMSFIGIAPLANAAVTLATDNGVAYTTTALTGYSTNGADMAGMMVTGTFADGTTSALSWSATGGVSGGVSNGFFSLTESGDTFGGNWTLTNLYTSALTRVVIRGAPGDTLFDVNNDTGSIGAGQSSGSGSPGSARGWTFDLQSLVSFDISATYRNIVSIGAAAPVGDLWETLDLTFSGSGLGTSGNMAFITDTDSAASAGDVIPTAVPEPETYAMMLAGLGLLGFMARRRKQKEAAAA